MKLVIELDEKIYSNLRNRGLTGMLTAKECECMNEAIYNGTPLPKGHGDLIDSNVLCEQYKKTCGDLYQALDLTPIIIEADKENKE